MRHAIGAPPASKAASTNRFEQRFSRDPSAAAGVATAHYAYLAALAGAAARGGGTLLLATDADDAGLGLRTELARRVGVTHCKEVRSWDAPPSLSRWVDWK